MNIGKVTFALLIITSFLFTAFTPIVEAETRRVWGFYYEGLFLDIYAPYQGYAGAEIPIRVRVEAEQNIRGLYVYILLIGSKNRGYGEWSYDWFALYGVNLSSGAIIDETHNIRIPSDVDSGSIYGYVWCEWQVPILLGLAWATRNYHGFFNAVYLRDLLDERDYWKGEYDRLQADYLTLRSEYDILRSNYQVLAGDLATARNLNYLFIATTIIFIATTIFLAFRRRKA